jgi:C1A family cysteine protease
MFAEWMRSFNKQYSSPAIAEQRLGYFAANLKLADERNLQEIEKGGNAVHGVTRFMDQDVEEFKKYFLGNKAGPAPSDVNTTLLRKIQPPQNKAVEDGAFVNWAGILTTPVKDQGYCGSCWAFSATEQIESDSMRTLGTDYILSPEQVTQCAPIAQGCGGGWTEVAYGYVHAAGGIETDDAYPYTSYNGVTGTCHVEKSQEVVTVNSFTSISGGETDMANYVLSTGPLSICLDANNWSTYSGGIMTVCGQQVDHCVQAVGVDTSSTGGYWIVRNSWGTSWGEDGYIYLAYGKNTCNLTNDPTWTTVSKVV